MKLIGSRMEQQMREELLRSNRSLQDGSTGGALVGVLQAANFDVTGAYVLNWIPEQAEDIYVVLAESGEILIAEIPRGAGQAHVERRELADYAKKCTKVQRLKIAVAQDLLASIDKQTKKPPAPPASR